MNISQNIQRRLLFDVIEKIKFQQLSPDYLQELLGIKKTALYSRINGKKLLSLDELTKLTQIFNLNLNRYFSNDSAKVEFQISAIKKRISHEDEFVETMYQRMSKIARLSDINLSYISSEVPVFNYFRYQEIALFKLYIFGKTVWEIPRLQNELFSLNQNEHIKSQRYFSQINDLYTAIPSTEIWNTHFLDNTLNQIKYYTLGGMFAEKEDIFLLLKQLSQLMKDLEYSAENGQKFYIDGRKGGNFSLYQNEIIHTSNVLLFDSLEKKFVVATYDNPNFLESDNPDFWNYSNKWLNSLKKRAQLITSQSERNRRILFNLCQQKIKRVRQFIEELDY